MLAALGGFAGGIGRGPLAGYRVVDFVAPAETLEAGHSAQAVIRLAKRRNLDRREALRRDA